MDKEKGQTLLIVVLVMIVALTVALSLVARTVTNLRNSNEQANSQKAFSAAEAGVEEALQCIASSGSCATITGSPNGNNFTADIQTLPSVSPTSFLFNNGNPVAKDDGVDLWLVDHNSNGTLNYANANYWQGVSGNSNPSLTFYWGSSLDSCSSTEPAALEVIVLYERSALSDNGASVKSARYVYDSCTSRGTYNNSSTYAVTSYPAPGKSIEGESFYYSAVVDIPNNSGILVRAVPLYANTPIDVEVAHCPSGQDCSFPSQGHLISSTGTSGQTARKITVFRGYSELPSEFFPYVLFAPAP